MTPENIFREYQEGSVARDGLRCQFKILSNIDDSLNSIYDGVLDDSLSAKYVTAKYSKEQCKQDYMPSFISRNIQEYIWLCDCNRTRTHNHIVRKRTLNHLTIWPVWLNRWVFVYEISGCVSESCCKLKLQVLRLFGARSSSTFRQL